MDVTSYYPALIYDKSIRDLLSSIKLPPPLLIKKLSTQGQYHLVYTLEYSQSELEDILVSSSAPSSCLHHPTRLLLRISGTQLPHVKTENESAILAYIKKHAPSIPVPIVLRYDSSTNNPIGHEYQIMTLCLGVEVDSIFRSWDTATKDDFLDQMIDLLRKIHSVPVNEIGGFAFRGSEIVSAPLCEEFNWQMPGIELHWKKHGIVETPQTINAQGPYKNWTQLNVGWLNKYISAIDRHPLMVEFRDLIPLLKNFILLLESGGPESWRLDDTRIVLAHRDLHFGNILYDVDKRLITGVIDWEFSGVAPFCKWDPPRAFLASLPYEDEGIIRKRGWVKDFQKRCEVKGVDWTELIFDTETGWSTKEQKLVYEAVDYMRCVFEVGPTGVRQDTVRSWRSIVEERLAALGIS